MMKRWFKGKDGADVVQREVTIKNKFGIHARPAALFVKTAAAFQADITVEKDGMKVNGKSIMGLLTVEGYQGAKLVLRAEGADAAEAIAALEDLLNHNFYED